MLDPKFDVEPNGDGPRELPNNNTLITILPQYVSGTVIDIVISTYTSELLRGVSHL